MGDVRACIYVLSQVYSGSSGLAGGDSPRHYFFLLFSFFVFGSFLLFFFVEGESILLSVGKILVDGSLRFFFLLGTEPFCLLLQRIVSTED